MISYSSTQYLGFLPVHVTVTAARFVQYNIRSCPVCVTAAYFTAARFLCPPPGCFLLLAVGIYVLFAVNVKVCVLFAC